MQIQLTWPTNPASELVTHYEVFEQVSDGFFDLKAIVTEAVYTFIPQAAVLHWKVRAVNFVGASEFSPIAEGPSAPSTPGTITVTVVG